MGGLIWGPQHCFKESRRIIEIQRRNHHNVVLWRRRRAFVIDIQCLDWYALYSKGVQVEFRVFWIYFSLKSEEVFFFFFKFSVYWFKLPEIWSLPLRYFIFYMMLLQLILALTRLPLEMLTVPRQNLQSCFTRRRLLTITKLLNVASGKLVCFPSSNEEAYLCFFVKL